MASDESVPLAESDRDTLVDSPIAVRGLMDNSRNFIGLMSVEGIVLDCNRTALRAAGVPASDVIGRPFWETQWWSHSEEMRERLKLAIRRAASGQADGFEATHPTPDGNIIYVDFSLSPVFNSDEEVTFLIPEGIDITARKRDEQRLKEANYELETFAYSASHDLRAPLRVISQLVDLINSGDEPLGPETEQLLSVIKGRTGRLSRLLDGLLAYARSSREQTELVEVDTGQLLKNVADLQDLRGDAFKVHIQANLPTLITNEAALSRVFMNLIGNAIKHHDKPFGKIDVTATESDRSVEFRFTDDGPGIDPQHHQRVFELFQTLKSKDLVEGSGMGLSIVRRTVERLGGDVQIESDGDRGTSFVVKLPKE